MSAQQPLVVPRHGQMTSALGYALLACAVGLVAGVVSASGRLDVIAILAGLVVGLAVASSRRAVLWFVIIGGVVVTGVAQLYWPSTRYIRYVVPLASSALLFHGVMDLLTRPAVSERRQTSGIMLWAVLFLILAVVSSIVNFRDMGVVLMGMRGYFQMWVFFFGFVLIRWRPAVIRSLPKGMLLIAFLQLPFVLHQYLVLVPRRVGLGDGLVPVDIVAGTFGGSLYGGGANAVLAAFMLIVVACVVGLWKNRGLTNSATLLMLLLFLAPVFINEAKISAIYLPLVYVLVFFKDIAAKPLRFLVAGGAMIGLLAALLTALTLAHPTQRLYSWSDLVAFTVERQTANVADRSGQFSELSRWTALTFWAEQHASANPVHILIGHGPGASRVQESGLDPVATLAERRYGGLKIGHTAVSALLWDTGVLGLLAVLGMLFAAFRSAGALTDHYRREQDRFRGGLFNGLRAGIAVLALSLAHKDFFVVNLPFQTLVLLILGYLVISQRQVTDTSTDSR